MSSTYDLDLWGHCGLDDRIGRAILASCICFLGEVVIGMGHANPTRAYASEKSVILPALPPRIQERSRFPDLPEIFLSVCTVEPLWFDTLIIRYWLLTKLATKLTIWWSDILFVSQRVLDYGGSNEYNTNFNIFRSFMEFFRRIFASRIARPEEISKHLSGLNPLIKWNLLNELGDGSFGKVLFIVCAFKDNSICYIAIIISIFSK